jgi:integrase
MLWHTGARRGELASLEYRHIDWDAQMAHLPRTKGRGRTRSRDVYIDDEAMERLTLYIHDRGDHEGPLFESTHLVAGTHQRAAMKPNTITLMLNRRCAQAGLGDLGDADFGAHAFRRAYARDWLDNGGAVTMLETNMGWKHDGRMAAQYTKVAETQLAAAEAQRVAAARRGGRHLRAVGD